MYDAYGEVTYTFKEKIRSEMILQHGFKVINVFDGKKLWHKMASTPATESDTQNFIEQRNMQTVDFLSGEHTLAIGTFEDKEVYVITSLANQKKQISYIEQESYLLLRKVFYDKAENPTDSVCHTFSDYRIVSGGKWLAPHFNRVKDSKQHFQRIYSSIEILEEVDSTLFVKPKD